VSLCVVEGVWYDMTAGERARFLAHFVQNAQDGKILLFPKTVAFESARLWKTMWKLCKTLQLRRIFKAHFFDCLWKSLVKGKNDDFSFSVV
jgi:hypothetical protein